MGFLSLPPEKYKGRLLIAGVFVFSFGAFLLFGENGIENLHAEQARLRELELQVFKVSASQSGSAIASRKSTQRQSLHRKTRPGSA